MEERGSRAKVVLVLVPGVSDEDDDDLNWIQTTVYSLVLLHHTTICFHFAGCF